MEDIFKKPDNQSLKKFKSDEPPKSDQDNPMRERSKDADPVDNPMGEQPNVEAGQVDLHFNLKRMLEKKLLEGGVDLNDEKTSKFANERIRKIIKNTSSQVKLLVHSVSEFWRSKVDFNQQFEPGTSKE